jgi:hypothetical protein
MADMGPNSILPRIVLLLAPSLYFFIDELGNGIKIKRLSECMHVKAERKQYKPNLNIGVGFGLFGGGCI